MTHRLRAPAAFVAAIAAIASVASAQTKPADSPAGPTPGSVLAAAPADAWRTIPADRLLVMEVATAAPAGSPQTRRVLIELAPDFAPAHVANIVALAKAHWFDGVAIVRSDENYVTQWGDPTEKKALPASVAAKVPAEYERPAAGLAFDPLPYRDAYAPAVGFSHGMPIAKDGGTAWLTHCYSMVGVARDTNPDTGSGAELYAIIGNQARGLDRNIAIVGRVVAGMDLLSGRARGAGAMGFYTDPAQRTPILSVRLAADMPEAERPNWRVLRTDTPSYAAWIAARTHRQDSFFVRGSGAVDLCSALPPARAASEDPAARRDVPK